MHWLKAAAAHSASHCCYLIVSGSRGSRSRNGSPPAARQAGGRRYPAVSRRCVVAPNERGVVTADSHAAHLPFHQINSSRERLLLQLRRRAKAHSTSRMERSGSGSAAAGASWSGGGQRERGGGGRREMWRTLAVERARPGAT
jgi:hypothetical protein